MNEFKWEKGMSVNVYRPYNQPVIVVLVERVTKTQVILKNGDKYRTKDGYLVGGGAWNRNYIKPC